MPYIGVIILYINTYMESKIKRKKTGGRTKGTPNKVTSMERAQISNLLEEYQESGLMASDFKELEAKDRLMIAEKLMQYTMPKYQSISVDMNAQVKSETIEEQLKRLAESN